MGDEVAAQSISAHYGLCAAPCELLGTPTALVIAHVTSHIIAHVVTVAVKAEAMPAHYGLTASTPLMEGWVFAALSRLFRPREEQLQTVQKLPFSEVRIAILLPVPCMATLAYLLLPIQL